MAKTLGLESMLDRRPKELSGGQRQRGALGRAIVRKPRVFLMDEPLSNLDTRLRLEMREELKRLHDKYRTTTVYVTHDQEEAMVMSDRIAILSEGRIQQCGTPKEVYEKPANLFVAQFIGSPVGWATEGCPPSPPLYPKRWASCARPPYLYCKFEGKPQTWTRGPSGTIALSIKVPKLNEVLKVTGNAGIQVDGKEARREENCPKKCSDDKRTYLLFFIAKGSLEIQIKIPTKAGTFEVIASGGAQFGT